MTKGCGPHGHFRVLVGMIMKILQCILAYQLHFPGCHTPVPGLAGRQLKAEMYGTLRSLHIEIPVFWFDM